MNAPETHITEPINAAHAVLMRATEALSISQIAQSIDCLISGTRKQLKELADLGLIEMEPRKGGTPFYFLTTPTQMQASPDEMKVISGEMQATSIDWTAPEMNYLAPEDYELPPADPEFLALANRELGRQLDAAKAERAELQTQLTATAADVVRTRQALTNAINEADRLRAELATERQAREALQEQTNAAPEQAITGYMVRAAKRKPRTIMDQGKAREAAMSAIRAGAQRAEVFALLPVGVARKGAEWRSA